MFNRGGVSAYGKGIASNLVTEEQRQRFNYGGRVGAWDGMSIGSGRGSNYGYGKVPEILSQEDLYKSYGQMGYGSRNIPDRMVEQEVGSDKDVIRKRAGNIFYEQQEKSAARKKEADALGVSVAELNAIERDQKSDQTRHEMVKEELFEKPTVVEKAKVIEANDRGDVMTDSDWMDLLGPTEEQKRRTKGEAQLNLAAGALDVFSQPTIAKGMKAASPHLSKLAQTASADQKARDKAILQGKVLSKVYTDRAGAKGEADIATLKWKADLLKTGTPADIYQAAIAGEEIKPKTIRDALYTASKGKIRAQTMPADEKKTKTLLADPTKEGKLYIQGQDIFVIKNGKFEVIELEDIFKTLKA